MLISPNEFLQIDKSLRKESFELIIVPSVSITKQAYGVVLNKKAGMEIDIEHDITYLHGNLTSL